LEVRPRKAQIRPLANIDDVVDVVRRPTAARLAAEWMGDDEASAQRAPGVIVATLGALGRLRSRMALRSRSAWARGLSQGGRWMGGRSGTEGD
jgi:hypothetical protein